MDPGELTRRVRVADVVTAAARAAPHLTVDVVFVTDGNWGLDVSLPEVAVAGAYVEAPHADDVTIPERPFWESAAARDLRGEIAALQSELAGLRTRIGALGGLPALRERLARDRRALGFGSRLDRASLLVATLFGGERPAFASGSLTFVEDRVRVDAELASADGNLADLVIAVPTAELPGGDVGWNFDEITAVGDRRVRGQLGWRARPPRH